MLSAKCYSTKELLISYFPSSPFVENYFSSLFFLGLKLNKEYFLLSLGRNELILFYFKENIYIYEKFYLLQCSNIDVLVYIINLSDNKYTIQFDSTNWA